MYFLAMGLAQGDSWPRTVKRLREELPTAFLVELGFWPAVDVVNFKFIPVRCVARSTATFALDVFLVRRRPHGQSSSCQADESAVSDGVERPRS